MKPIHLAEFDFRLLLILEAMLALRNVSRAAERLGMSQSAVSHALARLRLLLDDPLFVWSGGEMLPTPRAVALGEPVAEVIDRMRTALQSGREFDPARCDDSFTIGTNDFVNTGLLPRLLPDVSRKAPAARLRLAALDGRTDWGKLEDGTLDLAVAFFRAVPPHLKIRPLYKDRHVMVVRRGHPLLQQRLTVRRFVDAEHMVISPYVTGVVDEKLAEQGLTRRVVLALPSISLLPELLSRTDYVSTVAERVAQVLAARHPLELRPLPFPLKPLTVSMVWHLRRHHAPAQQWLRGVVTEMATG
jgi:DNA-binding transcriptional LysR family regulator